MREGRINSVFHPSFGKSDASRWDWCGEQAELRGWDVTFPGCWTHPAAQLWGGKSNQLLLFPKKIVKAGEEEVERRVKHPKGNDVTTYFGTNQPSATQR